MNNSDDIFVGRKITREEVAEITEEQSFVAGQDFDDLCTDLEKGLRFYNNKKRYKKSLVLFYREGDTIKITIMAEGYGDRYDIVLDRNGKWKLL